MKETNICFYEKTTSYFDSTYITDDLSQQISIDWNVIELLIAVIWPWLKSEFFTKKKFYLLKQKLIYDSLNLKSNW